MTVLEYGGRLLVVDCGVLFPEDHQPGVDLILPDFDYIRDRLDDIEAIVLTHAHEDHIGAVPYLLREKADIPLDRVAADAGAGRGQAARAPHQAVHARGQGGADRAGRAVRPASSSRSTTRSPTRSRSPSARRRQLLLHTGDFKMDQLPARRPDHRPAGLRAARRGGRRPVPGRLDQRRGARLRHVPSARSSRCIDARVRARRRGGSSSACFASHVHRVQQVLDAAHTHGRKVAFVGRSMVRNMGVARDLGYLTIPAG